jgi:DNA primase
MEPGGRFGSHPKHASWNIRKDTGLAWRQRAGVKNVDEIEELIEVREFEQQGGTIKPHMQFVIDQAVRDRNLSHPPEKAQAVEEVLPFIRAVPDPIEKREYFDIAMNSLLVQSDQRREIWQLVRRGANVDASAVQKLITPKIQPTVAEEKLLGLLLAGDELRNIILPRLEPEDYEVLPTAAIFRALKELGACDKEISFESLTEATADNLMAAEFLPRLMMNEPAESFDESLADANSCLDALRLMKLDRDIDELSTQIAEADRNGENEERDRLAMKKLGLSKQRSTFLPHGKAGN